MSAASSHGAARARALARGRARALHAARPLALGALLAALGDAAPAAAGCAVPEPALWSPASDAAAPLDARVVVSLGGYAGLVRAVELRAVGGDVVAARQRELPGPLGQRLLELTPEAPLAAGTTYELVARRPASWHPNEWVFGAFTTGRGADASAPALRVLAARLAERATGAGRARRWIELDLATQAGADESRAALFAVWLPDARGRLDLDAPPSVLLPREGDTLRISSPEPCGGHVVPLPELRARAEIGVAALDAAHDQSPVQRVAIDFTAPGRDP